MILPWQWAVQWLCSSPHTLPTGITFVLVEQDSMVEREVRINLKIPKLIAKLMA